MSQDEADRPGGQAGSGGPLSERMQALLSRAAEEQLTEQRQVSSVLSELRQLVTGLGEQLRGVASGARLDGVAGDVDALAREVRSLSTALGERLDALGRQVDGQGAALAAVQRELSGLHDRLAATLAEQVAGLVVARPGGDPDAVPPDTEPVLPDAPDEGSPAPPMVDPDAAGGEKLDGAGSRARRSRFLDDSDQFPEVAAADVDDPAQDGVAAVPAQATGRAVLETTPPAAADPGPPLRSAPATSSVHAAVTTSTAPRRYAGPAPRLHATAAATEPAAVADLTADAIRSADLRQDDAPPPVDDDQTPGDHSSDDHSSDGQAPDAAGAPRQRPWWRPGG